MCVHGEPCSSFAPGHALHLIQARLAAATPSEWADAVIESTDAVTGVIALRTLEAGERVELWCAARAAHEIAPGTPVALHGGYEDLSLGPARFNVAASRINAAQRR